MFIYFKRQLIHQKFLASTLPPPPQSPSKKKKKPQILRGFIIEKVIGLVPLCKAKLWMQLCISIPEDKPLSIALHGLKKKSEKK